MVVGVVVLPWVLPTALILLILSPYNNIACYTGYTGYTVMQVILGLDSSIYRYINIYSLLEI